LQEGTIGSNKLGGSSDVFYLANLTAFDDVIAMLSSSKAKILASPSLQPPMSAL
jgi:hypothetical protein